MNPAAMNPTQTETSLVPLARIDAQETSFAIPIREYLEANGCRVIIDGETREHATYHIVAGDVDFVKQIIASARTSGERTLGIVVGSSLSDAKNLAGENKKIIVVDPVALTREDVVEMFSYFFSGNDEVLNKKRNRHVPTAKNQEPGPENTESEEKKKEDEKRIGSIITEVFERPHSKKQKKQRKRFWMKALLTIIIVFAPVLWYTGSLLVTGVSFMQAAKQLQSGNTKNAQRLEGVGGYWLQQGRVVFGVLQIPLQIAGRTETIRGQERLLSFFGDTKTAFDQTHEVIALGKDVATMVLTSGTEVNASPASALERLRLATVSLGSSLGLAQAQLTTLLSDRTLPFFIGPIEVAGSRALTSLADIRRTVSYGESLLVMYPHLAGFDEPKTYLILMQNSAELRPTGGFIGSIGKLTFSGGAIRDLTIQDVYALDGQLKGHVDPPLPIRELLGQEHWYLRDSNWDPDFANSGARAAWFYEKETGETVAGVIGISLPLVVDLLKVTGPIVMSDYNEQITADNFLGKSIYYTKDNFFPGSTAKADFLGTLARALLLRVTTDTRANPAKLFQVFVTGVTRRDIQFLFTDQELQQLVEHFGWAGRLVVGNGCAGLEQTTCLVDPLVVNEANLSVSKVNAFIKHENHREIVVTSDGTVSETSTVTITNTATDNEPGVGGTYRMYIRFFFPIDVSIDDITLDGAPVTPRESKEPGPPSLPYTERVEAPAQTQGLGVGLEVAPGTNRRLRISYTRGIKMQFPDRSSVLDILQQKQAGLSDVVQTLTIYYPVFWKATSQSEEESTVAKDGELEYNSLLRRDLRVRVLFTK